MLRQPVFRSCTLSISVLASQELRSDLGCDAMLDYLIGDISVIYFMAKASVQQVQRSLVLQPSTNVWNVSIFVLQSPDTDVSMTMSAQLSSMLALQFFRVSPEAEADLRTFEI